MHIFILYQCNIETLGIALKNVWNKNGKHAALRHYRQRWDATEGNYPFRMRAFFPLTMLQKFLALSWDALDSVSMLPRRFLRLVYTSAEMLWTREFFFPCFLLALRRWTGVSMLSSRFLGSFFSFWILCFICPVNSIFSIILSKSGFHSKMLDSYKM